MTFHRSTLIPSLLLSGMLVFSATTLKASDVTESLATQAHQALLLRQYDVAAAAFAKQEATLRAENLPGVDGALYWQAYVALQQHRQRNVARLVSRLRHEFPDSVWLDDANALLPGQSLADWLAPPIPRDIGSTGPDPKKEAINSEINAVISADPDAAVSNLQALLQARPNDDLLAARALYALGVLDSAAAENAATKLIDDRQTGELTRSNAYVLLARSTNPVVQENLRSRYVNLSDVLRQQLVNAWAVAGNLQSIHYALQNERDTGVRWQVINALGVLADEPGLIAVIRDAHSEADQLAAINGLAVSERSGALLTLLDEPEMQSVQLPIIRSLGTAGGQDSITRLAQLFAAEPPQRGVRQAAADALAQLGAGDQLLALFTDSSDPASRETLMTAIRRLHDPALLAKAEALALSTD